MHLDLQKVISQLKQAKNVLFVSLIATVSFSAKADYKSEIVESCQKYQAGINKDHVNACKLYIDGFIDAAVFTESAKVVDENSKLTSKEKSPFMQRAYQNRAIRRLSTDSDDFDYQFCLSHDQDRKLIASKIAKTLNVSELESKSLKRVLSETLSRTFPCEK